MPGDGVTALRWSGSSCAKRGSFRVAWGLSGLEKKTSRSLTGGQPRAARGLKMTGAGKKTKSGDPTARGESDLGVMVGRERAQLTKQD